MKWCSAKSLLKNIEWENMNCWLVRHMWPSARTMRPSLSPYPCVRVRSCPILTESRCPTRHRRWLMRIMYVPSVIVIRRASLFVMLLPIEFELVFLSLSMRAHMVFHCIGDQAQSEPMSVSCVILFCFCPMTSERSSCSLISPFHPPPS